MRSTSIKVRSQALGNEREIWIREPENAGTAEHLVVLLDGEFYRERVSALEVIEELNGKIADAWFVFVSTHSAEARWVECECHRPFATFVVEELLPELRRQHPELSSVEQRTLAGLSYTGLAAAYVVHEYPGVFRRAICQSGSFWWNDCWLVGRYAQLAAPLPTAFFLDVGTRETQENVRHKEDVLQVVSQVDGVRRFRDTLVRTGHEAAYVEFVGGHEFAGWKRTLPEALRWALLVAARHPRSPNVSA